MAKCKINIIGLVPPTDKRYKEGWTITVQPDLRTPTKPPAKPKK